MRRVTLLILLLSMTSYTGLAEEYVVSQKNKSFSEDKISINVGDTVHFLNEDPFFTTFLAYQMSSSSISVPIQKMRVGQLFLILLASLKWNVPSIQKCFY